MDFWHVKNSEYINTEFTSKWHDIVGWNLLNQCFRVSAPFTDNVQHWASFSQRFLLSLPWQAQASYTKVESIFATFLAFRIDPDLLELTGCEVSALSEQLKRVFRWNAWTTGDGIVSITEHGNGQVFVPCIRSLWIFGSIIQRTVSFINGYLMCWRGLKYNVCGNHKGHMCFEANQHREQYYCCWSIWELVVHRIDTKMSFYYQKQSLVTGPMAPINMFINIYKPLLIISLRPNVINIVRNSSGIFNGTLIS